jgi:hypothetical protein
MPLTSAQRLVLAAKIVKALRPDLEGDGNTLLLVDSLISEALAQAQATE